MTLQVGDKTVVIPLRDGGRVAVRSGTISVGDKAVLIPGANGQIYAVRPASPQVGDKVILYPLRDGGHVCLASADDEGGSSPSVMPPGNFDARRTGPSTADLKWLPGEGNTAVRIVRRPDRYPVHINDGTAVYEGAGREATDIGLGFRDSYYYCAWGKAGSKYSNGYLMDRIYPWGSQSDPILICDAWHRAVAQTGEAVEFGPFTFNWDGQGRVYVSRSATEALGIAVDDWIIISGPGGTINPVADSGVDSWWNCPQCPHICEITSVLRSGPNTLTVAIQDNPNIGANIGTCTALYIMRTL